MPKNFTLSVQEKFGKNREIELWIRVEGDYGGSYIKIPFQSFDEAHRELSEFRKAVAAIENKLAEHPANKGPDEKLTYSFELQQDPESNWTQLEKIENDLDFFKTFNTLEEEYRKSIADYVFSNQNIFKGKASVFSLHYDEEDSMLK